MRIGIASMRATFQNRSVIMIPIVFLRITLRFYDASYWHTHHRQIEANSSNPIGFRWKFRENRLVNIECDVDRSQNEFILP